MNYQSVVIIGGGRAGLQAALAQAKAGKKVYLVEKNLGLDGAHLTPDENLAGEGLDFSSELKAVRECKDIELITNADVEAVEQSNGKFKLKLIKRPSRVIADKCGGCKKCISICPINYDDGLALCTAIDYCSPDPSTFGVFREDRPICQELCPVHLDIRGYVGLIADGKFDESLALIRQRLPFPGIIGRICTHPCEQGCNRGTQDQALAIRDLKRFVADCEIKAGETPRTITKAASRLEKVAIIGAGPAGLTCAHDLALKGYQATIFESLPIAGGMLCAGIPEYRLPRDILRREIAMVEELGVEIKTNTTIGKDITIDGLFEQGFKAIFIGVGAHGSMKLGLPGEEAEGVVPGVRFLRDLNLGRPVQIGERVAIVGGGNVAMDAARSVLRKGTKKVFILYRRTRQEMPASNEEIEAAEAEGIDIQYLVAPLEILTKDGKVKGIRCLRMKLGDADASGRRRPIPIQGSEFDIELEMVIPAIGQIPILSFLEGTNIKTTRRGTIEVDPETLATSRPGVFAGGDVVTGPWIAIGAVAAGQKVAATIDKYLRGA